MKICYLLETTDLWGGVRIVFDQAQVLGRRGHDVVIRALGGDHRWYPHEVKIDYVKDLSAPFYSSVRPKPDVTVATFWTTVQAAVKLNCRLTFHLCQGYEGDSVEYAARKGEIEDAYRLPIPKITVGEWLSKRLVGLFGADAFEIHVVGQIVDLDIFHPLPFWRQRSPGRLSEKARILISGLYEASVKAIPDALRAVTDLRHRGYGIHLTRVSTIDTRIKESVLASIDEYHCKIPPRVMADLYRSHDLLIAPSLSHEGFGLPFAEALACGLPAVATAIPSHMSFDENPDYACFVPERDTAAMAAAAARIIGDKDLRNYLSKRGVEVVRRNFSGDLVSERLEHLFERMMQ